MHKSKRHHHTHQPGSANHHASTNIAIAFFLNLFFTAIEFAGGILTNSMAVLSDAVHDLGDSFFLGFSYYMEKIAKQKERIHSKNN